MNEASNEQVSERIKIRKEMKSNYFLFVYLFIFFSKWQISNLVEEKENRKH